MKKGRNLLVFASVLAVFIAAYLLIKHTVGNPAADETGPAATLVSVTETNPADIRAISYIYNGETYSFEWNGGAWLSSADAKMPLDQTALGEMASAISVVKANRHLSEEGASAADYGFADPYLTVNVTYADKSVLTYYLGSVSSHTGEYYLAMMGREDVWMVNAYLADYFMYTYKDLLTVDSMESIQPENVIKLTAEYPDGRVRTLKKSSASLTSGDENGGEASEAKTIYLMTNEAGAEAEYDKDAGLLAIKAFTGAPLTAQTCVEYHTDENTDLSAYGLDAPITLTITYEKEIAITAESSSGSIITKEFTYTVKLGLVYSPAAQGEPEAGGAEADSPAQGNTAEGETEEPDSDGAGIKIAAYLMLPDSVMIFGVDIQNAGILIY